MEKIASFRINHLALKRGVYVSRVDRLPEGGVVTTIDVRMAEPSAHIPIDGATLHTIEHLAATFLRNHPVWKDRVVYWGPMGCRTGNYLLLAGEYTSADVVDLMKELFGYIADFEGDIPGASDIECGNPSYNNLGGAKAEARRYLTEVLNRLTPTNLTYPE